MYTDIPELFPKITPDEIRNVAKIGCGADLRNLVNLLRFFGVFGNTENSNRLISQRIYLTKKSWITDENNVSKLVIDDKNANQRFDNIIRGKLSLAPRELEYFRLCLRRAFGDNLGATLSDDQILNGSANATVKELLSEAPALDWTRVDPLNALLAFVATSSTPLDVEFDDRSSDFRMVVQEEGYDADFRQGANLVLKPGARFKLLIPLEQSQTKPIVINFSNTPGATKSGIDVRAQVMSHIVRTEDKEGPWRVSAPRNVPLTIGPNPGHFGFLVIAGAGCSMEQLFSDDHDPYALNDADLKHLYEVLIQASKSGDPIKTGLINYQVQA